MNHPADPHRPSHPDEARDERAEAAEHASDAGHHRREAASDRAEAARDRAEGDPIEAAGNEVEAKGHEVAADVHERAGRHDAKEAATAERTTAREGDYAGTAATGHGEPAVPAEGTPHGSGAASSRPTLEGSAAATGASAAPSGSNGEALIGEEHRRRFRSRWDEIQASFIDEPRRSVSEADALVREATEALHSIFERDRRQLEGVWDRGDEVSTEDLRVTLQRYRSFFERLVSI